MDGKMKLAAETAAAMGLLAALVHRNRRRSNTSALGFFTREQLSGLEEYFANPDKPITGPQIEWSSAQRQLGLED